MKIKVGFVVLVKDEVAEFKRLMAQIYPYVVKNGDELVVVSDVPENENVIAAVPSNAVYVKNALNGDFANQRNLGDAQLSPSVTHVFHIDADEMLEPALLEMLRCIIEENCGVELFKFPRINIVRGITEKDVRNWGWAITKSDSYVVYNEAFLDSEYKEFLTNRGFIRASGSAGSFIYHLPIINFPDYQGRLYVRAAGRITWHGKVHEKIFGDRVSTKLPAAASLGIIHDKTITRQRAQNALYQNIIGTRSINGTC